MSTHAPIRRLAAATLGTATIFVAMALIAPGQSLAAGKFAGTAVNPSIVQGSTYSGSLGTLTEECPPIIEVVPGSSPTRSRRAAH
jgi:hypothetical protein